MDGATLLRYGEEALGGIHNSDLLRFYDCLDRAAAEFCRQTGYLHGSVDLTTVEAQQAYELPADFIRLYMKSTSKRRLIVKYYDASNDEYTFPVASSYEKIFEDNDTDEKDVPDCFCIKDIETKPSVLSGAVTSSGVASLGESVLTDSGASFQSTAEARDSVHNITDGSIGRVLGVTDDNNLRTALFNGTNNEWTSGDTYKIVPGKRYELLLDAPSDVDGDTITVPYVTMPDPVFSDLGFWRFPPRACIGIAFEAAFLFKADYDFDMKRDGHLRELFNEEVQYAKNEIAQAILQGGQYPYR